MKYIVLSLATVSIALPGALRQSPADSKIIFNAITHHALATIKTEEQLHATGTITSLIIRPQSNTRLAVDSAHLTKNGIVGDLRAQQDSTTTPPDAVTLMRSDVSDVLGGAHLSGDNIHVEGLHIGEKYVKTGDLLIVRDVQTAEIKTILLKTLIPHYGCWKFISRFGQNAFDLCNAEGNYPDGIQTPAGLIHGTQHRLRGLRLIVLKEGTINIGDHVAILADEEKEQLLTDFNLHAEYAHALEVSKPIGEKYEKKQQLAAALRKKQKNI